MAAVERARELLAAQRWAEAHEAYSAVEPDAMTGEDLVGLADSAWWVSRLQESLEHRRRAYAWFEAAGDDRGSAAAAARAAIEHFVRGEPSVGAGYLMRAHRHAEALEDDVVERGWLAAVDAAVAMYSGDPDRSVRLADEAIASGRRHGDRDLAALAIHVGGLALVGAGRVREGMALLDEAMVDVLGGALSPYFTGVIYCAVIAKCLELGDVRRAGEWSDAAQAWCESLPAGSPFPGMCRVSRAEVSAFRGAWSDAEAEAELASRELMEIEPGLAGWAVAQVADIRRRLGDLAAAEAAFERAQELGADPQPGLALVRLAQRRIHAARGALRLALADAPPHAPRRARLLSANVEVALAAGDLEEARSSADQLAEMAQRLELPSFVASAAEAAGAVALAAGETAPALAALRRAGATWQSLKLPYEAARTRLVLGRALRSAGDDDGARIELRAALAAFERLGASADASAARTLLLDDAALPGGLTNREAEVLRLVAGGRTNRDIAVALVISEHTVARHLQNIFGKLGVSSRAGATAYAFEHGLA